MSASEGGMTTPIVPEAPSTPNTKDRVGQPAEIASAVTYFMSEGASFTTGQHLFVCGGLSIGFPML